MKGNFKLMKIYNFTIQALKSNYLLITIFMIALPLIMLPFFKIIPLFLIILAFVVLLVNLFEINKAKHYVYASLGGKFYEVYKPDRKINISDNKQISKELLYFKTNNKYLVNNIFKINKIATITHKSRVRKRGIKKSYSYYFIKINQVEKHIDAIYYKSDIRLSEAFNKYIEDSKSWL